MSWAYLNILKQDFFLRVYLSQDGLWWIQITEEDQGKVVSYSEWVSMKSWSTGYHVLHVKHFSICSSKNHMFLIHKSLSTLLLSQNFVFICILYLCLKVYISALSRWSCMFRSVLWIEYHTVGMDVISSSFTYHSILFYITWVRYLLWALSCFPRVSKNCNRLNAFPSNFSFIVYISVRNCMKIT